MVDLLWEHKPSSARECFEEEAFFNESSDTIMDRNTVYFCLTRELIDSASAYMDTRQIDLCICFVQS